MDELSIELDSIMADSEKNMIALVADTASGRLQIYSNSKQDKKIIGDISELIQLTKLSSSTDKKTDKETIVEIHDTNGLLFTVVLYGTREKECDVLHSFDNPSDVVMISPVYNNMINSDIELSNIIINKWYKVDITEQIRGNNFNSVYNGILSNISKFSSVQSSKFEYRMDSCDYSLQANILNDPMCIYWRQVLHRFSEHIFSFYVRPFIEPHYYFPGNIPVYNEFHIEYDYESHCLIGIKTPYEKEWFDVNIHRFNHEATAKIIYDSIYKEIMYSFETNLLKCENEIVPVIDALPFDKTVVFRFVLDQNENWILMEAHPLSKICEQCFLNATRNENQY